MDASNDRARAAPDFRPPPVSDRSFTPRELHLKAISVADQLDRLAAASRDGVPIRGREVEIVVAAAAQLRRRVVETAQDPVHTGAQALADLDAARVQVVRALELAVELADRVPVAGRAGRGGPPPPAG